MKDNLGFRVVDERRMFLTLNRLRTVLIGLRYHRTTPTNCGPILNGALDLAGIAHDAVVSRFSRPAPSIGEADDFKIERQLIFVRSAERIGIDRSSATREQRLLVSDATLIREGCKRIRQAVRQER
jgi:hypothetical protein